MSWDPFLPIQGVFPPVAYAFAYGSGVFHQPGLYGRDRTGSDKEVGGDTAGPMLDYIFAVNDPTEWHAVVGYRKGCAQYREAESVVCLRVVSYNGSSEALAKPFYHPLSAEHCPESRPLLWPRLPGPLGRGLRGRPDRGGGLLPPKGQERGVRRPYREKARQPSTYSSMLVLSCGTDIYLSAWPLFLEAGTAPLGPPLPHRRWRRGAGWSSTASWRGRGWSGT